MPLLASGGRYFEPFLGSAAVFFALRARGWRGEPFLSDLLYPLVWFYRTLYTAPDLIHRGLVEIEKAYRESEDPKAFYKKQRKIFNEVLGGPTYKSTLFLWLNHRGFNGLWRTNAKGDLTTDWGGPRSYLPSLSRLEEASRLMLDNTEIDCWDFETAISKAKAGDVIYADPPYAVGYRYYAGSFNQGAQARLASCLKAAWERGAFVVASNSDTPEVRALYSWAEIRPVSLKYSVGGANQKQGKEVIIVARGAR